MQEHFEKLRVWQAGMNLVGKVYRVSKGFPKEEQYGLTSQMRRAAVSVPANIAEGKGRGHKKEFVQFLSVARGSVFEVLTLIHVAKNLGYLSVSAAAELIGLASQVTAMLTNLIKSQEEG